MMHLEATQVTNGNLAVGRELEFHKILRNQRANVQLVPFQLQKSTTAEHPYTSTCSVMSNLPFGPQLYGSFDGVSTTVPQLTVTVGQVTSQLSVQPLYSVLVLVTGQHSSEQGMLFVSAWKHWGVGQELVKGLQRTMGETCVTVST